MIRQGDILLIPLAATDARVRRADRSRAETRDSAVLAHGEQSGHAHVLHGRAVYYMDTGSNGRRLIEVEKPAQLRHQKPDGSQADHRPHELPPAWYEFRRQREFVEASPRWVAD